MKVERPPLLFRRTSSGLMPANDAAAEACGAFKLGDVVKAKITKSTGFQKRMALYWIVLAKAAEALNDKIEGEPLDAEMLHLILKDRKGLYRETVLPSGEVVKNYASISFSSMPENERSTYVSWAFQVLASWLHCTVQDLTEET